MLNQFNDFVKDHSFNKEDTLWSMNALVGELGEVANVLKKEKYYEQIESYQKRVDSEVEDGSRKPFREQKIDELGDTLFFFCQVANACNITLEEIMKYQMEKILQQGNDQGYPFLK